VIAPALLDASAWSRMRQPSARSADVIDAITAGRLLVCLPFLLEAGFSARSAAEHTLMVDSLLDLPRVEIDRAVEDRALAAQRQLARAGHHRIPPTDLVVAALADCHGVGVLHYDHHYDLILERTDLRYEGVWLAEPGSL
jgi:predicted nucleic acid-binding protein